jgi:hypothetical protein
LPTRGREGEDTADGGGAELDDDDDDTGSSGLLGVWPMMIECRWWPNSKYLGACTAATTTTNNKQQQQTTMVKKDEGMVNGVR